ncbi:MAG TPA: hypothetical protein DHV42_06700 [Lachnospiraceae bacterium]|nr:hypothetical protein [Lachnospiraceae bacterium]
MKELLRSWIEGETDPLEDLLDTSTREDQDREARKKISQEKIHRLEKDPKVQESVERVRKRFRKIYLAVAIISCISLSCVLLYTISLLPRYGAENPRATEVVSRYVEKGIEETGAVNIVSGMILDYRAFDTLGESHVLFTALICVMILLRIDRKNQRTGYEDYYTIRSDTYYDLSKDAILPLIGRILLPCILLYGIYILLNGQNSPGGGFSGGAVIGAGMILFSAAFGMKTADRFLTLKLCNMITFVSLAFYAFAKGYVFFMGANGLESHIPKGTPGAILSGGMILPLDIAVGLVVSVTMFGFYSLFRRGSIGMDVDYESFSSKRRKRPGGKKKS